MLLAIAAGNTTRDDITSYIREIEPTKKSSSGFGKAAAATHGLWTVDGTTYELTDEGRASYEPREKGEAAVKSASEKTQVSCIF